MRYVGLTGNPHQRKEDHKDPADWWQRSFVTESEARAWEEDMLAKPGYTGDTGGKGWQYGYTYTITSSTRE